MKNILIAVAFVVTAMVFVQIQAVRNPNGKTIYLCIFKRRSTYQIYFVISVLIFSVLGYPDRILLFKQVMLPVNPIPVRILRGLIASSVADEQASELGIAKELNVFAKILGGQLQLLLLFWEKYNHF